MDGKFTLNRRIMLEICKDLIKWGIAKWKCSTRVDTINEEQLDWMKSRYASISPWE